jgi:hypothetical protein
MRNQTIPEREYRSIGRFSAEEVRKLAGGPLDPVRLGCPITLFERILEKRAALRATPGYRPPLVSKPPRPRYQPMTDAEVAAAAREELRNVSPEVLQDRARRERQAKVQQQMDADYLAEVEQWRTRGY